MMGFALAATLALLVGAAVALYAYVTRHFAYWRRKGVPSLPPIPVAGNLKDVLLFRRHFGEVLHQIYRDTKKQPYIGLFFFDQPVLLVNDISFLKEILHKDFDYFNGRGFTPAKNDTIFKETLFATKEQKWKNLRLHLKPAFSHGRLKRFYLLLQRKASNLDHFFDDIIREGIPYDVSHACARYTMDAVATVGFGIDTTALMDDNDILHRLLRKVFVYNKIYALASLATFVDVPLLSLLKVSLIPAPLASFLRRTIWGVVEERHRTGRQEARGDFLDVLIELRDKGRIAGDDGLPDEDAASIDMDGDVLIAQAFTFLSAGFDTSSITMTFALYHLAKNENIQERLRNLLQLAVSEHGGNLTYEALQSVGYLDMIVSETLRMYPVLPFLDRVCTKDYQIPGSDIVLNKGVFVFASIFGIQRDPEYYPDPDRFDPERFSEINKVNIPSGCYFPFGDGPRKCLGLRLALLQSKLGLAHIILNYKLHPCAETPSDIEFNMHTFFITPRNGIHLKFTRV